MMDMMKKPVIIHAGRFYDEICRIAGFSLALCQIDEDDGLNRLDKSLEDISVLKQRVREAFDSDMSIADVTEVADMRICAATVFRFLADRLEGKQT